MRRAYREVAARAKEEGIALREAAYLVGIERVVEAARTRGYVSAKTLAASGRYSSKSKSFGSPCSNQRSSSSGASRRNSGVSASTSSSSPTSCSSPVAGSSLCSTVSRLSIGGLGSSGGSSASSISRSSSPRSSSSPWSASPPSAAAGSGWVAGASSASSGARRRCLGLRGRRLSRRLVEEAAGHWERPPRGRRPPRRAAASVLRGLAWLLLRGSRLGLVGCGRLGGLLGLGSREVGIAGARRRPEGLVLELFQLVVVGAQASFELQMLADRVVENAHRRLSLCRGD